MANIQDFITEKGIGEGESKDKNVLILQLLVDIREELKKLNEV